MSEVELAWLAGLLEGEGCFTIQRTNGGRYAYPAVQLNMTDEDVVRRAAALMGDVAVGASAPPSRAGGKTQYRCRLVGSRAAALMVLLLPRMGSRRRDRIREVLASTAS